MTRTSFEQELLELQDSVLVLGSMVEKATIKAVEALKNRDVESARRIIKEDELVNAKRFEIEQKGLRLLATQQPMASDLRTIVAVLQMTVDLERMGDHAEGIAKVVTLIGDEPLIKPLVDIPRMRDLALSMLRRALKAFVERDIEAARQVCRDDDDVDALHDQVYHELITYMLKDPRNITQATYLTWVAHNLERIADRSTNLCEQVVFIVTGKREQMGVSKY
ncbi:MAG: phosphate signaling complex protein PhoU [Chloroflexi bacterium]|nr:phosphate signaling complex protein PhoU [Chloroflexota bacterium]